MLSHYVDNAGTACVTSPRRDLSVGGWRSPVIWCKWVLEKDVYVVFVLKQDDSRCDPIGPLSPCGRPSLHIYPSFPFLFQNCPISFSQPPIRSSSPTLPDSHLQICMSFSNVFGLPTTVDLGDSPHFLSERKEGRVAEKGRGRVRRGREGASERDSERGVRG